MQGRNKSPPHSLIFGLVDLASTQQDCGLLASFPMLAGFMAFSAARSLIQARRNRSMVALPAKDREASRLPENGLLSPEALLFKQHVFRAALLVLRRNGMKSSPRPRSTGGELEPGVGSPDHDQFTSRAFWASVVRADRISSTRWTVFMMVLRKASSCLRFSGLCKCASLRMS
jgi:hypothetical protein